VQPVEPERDPSEADRIVALARQTLTAFIDDPEHAARAVARAGEDLPDDVLQALETLALKADSYRDALLVQLAVPLVRGRSSDITRRARGGRSASGRIGDLLRTMHIKRVNNAFENIGKNTPELVRGNNLEFDYLLRWGSQAELRELEIAYGLVAASIAATARSVAPRPRLRLARLTFAGDIELFRGGRLQEGIEVSRSLWRDKLSQAEDALRAYGLGRAHIVARSDDEDLYGELRRVTDRDISVIDPRAVVSVLVALLDRGGREQLLLHVYELLDEMVASPDLVNQFVDRLRTAELVEG
jgi:hypothetical protein